VPHAERHHLVILNERAMARRADESSKLPLPLFLWQPRGDARKNLFRRRLRRGRIRG
jgi:hypothetical protein